MSLTPGPSSEDIGFEGRVVGHFRLGRRLGEGGMSSVYLGRRTGDFEQLAAVKLLREGLHDPDTLSRFRAERQVLAGLAHPNIVGLLDGGVTEDGIPYLAMEYVEGVPLDQHCDAARIPISRRLELMIQVLEAVEHAHRHFLAHCDLKFSNILVTAQGAPRLLDFGVTKLLEPTRFGLCGQETHTGLRPYSLGFASPEQLRGESLTTATDTYSAGVILYMLLAGRHPFEAVRHQPLALTRVTLTQEPDPPSRAFRRLMDTDRAAAGQVAQARGATPAQLARSLNGDLDAIVLKAMRREPDRRFTSAAQFAGELRDCLAGRPVASRRGSRAYRAGKFVERHRASAVVAVLLAIALLAGIAGVFRQAILARQSRLEAQARFHDAVQMTGSLLADFYLAVQKLDGSTAAQRSLMNWSRETLESLTAQAGGDGVLETALAEAYFKLGNIQTASQPLEASTSFRRGLQLADRALAARPKDAAAIAIRQRLTAVLAHR